MRMMMIRRRRMKKRMIKRKMRRTIKRMMRIMWRRKLRRLRKMRLIISTSIMRKRANQMDQFLSPEHLYHIYWVG